MSFKFCKTQSIFSYISFLEISFSRIQMTTIGCLTGPFHICELWTLFFISLILCDCMTLSLHFSNYRIKNFRYNFIEVQRKTLNCFISENFQLQFQKYNAFFKKQLTEYRNSFFKTIHTILQTSLHLLTFELIWYSSLPDCTLDSVYTVS